MASLKRYKQPSENNINRFQDLPPRFKRQKSFTSRTPTMETTNQNTSPNQKNKKSSWGDSLTTSWSTTSHHKGSSLPREGRKIVKKLSTQKAQANAENSLLKTPAQQPFVLSPMENKLFSLTRNDECLNSDFAHTINQNHSNTDHMLGLHTLAPMNQQTVPVSKTFQANGHNQTNLNSNAWTRESPTSKQFEMNEQPKNSLELSNSEQHIDYSDPDIRTIEMLRELERVADQTDVGNDESSNDKNSLVSHHLRMLMCAVDRYTQGVDEDGNDSGEDESCSSSEDIQHTQSQLPFNEHSNTNIQGHPKKHSCPGFSSDKTFEQNQGCFPTNPSTVHQYVAIDASDNNPLSHPWGVWSTPSFNGLDVYPSRNIHNTSYMNNPAHFMFDMSYSRDSCY